MIFSLKSWEKQYNNTTMKRDHNYWIKGDQVIPVAEDHFNDILQSPEQFGLTKEKITELIGAAGGPSGSNGSAEVPGPARDMVIKKAIENGWIRIRSFAGSGTADTRVVIQGHQMDAKSSAIQDLISQLRNRDVITDTAVVVISDTATGDSRSFRIGPDTIDETVEGDLELS